MGGKKKQTVGYKYFLGQHLILCHGPIDKILQVIIDDKNAYTSDNWVGGSININKPNLFGGEDGEGGISGKFDLELGGPTQTANSYLVSKLSPSLVPAFRGVTGVVLNQIYVGTQAYLKKIAFKAKRIHTRSSEGLVQWYDEKAEININNLNVSLDDNNWKYKIENPGSIVDYSDPNYDDSAWSTGPGGFGSNNDGGIYPVGTYVSAGVTGKGIWIRRKINIENTYLVSDLNLEVYHDDGCWLYWNGELIETIPFEAYHEKAIIPANKLLKVNTIALKVLDGVPYGSPANIFAGIAIAGEDSTPSDMNPAHIIRECLTNSDWGMGYQDADIDDVSFMAAADKLYEEKMGMSLLWNRQTTIDEFINEIVKHIDASIYVDKSTGKFKLKLVRFDYDVNDLIILNPSNIEHISDFTRPTFGELTNSITVKYYDSNTGKDASVTIQDIALSQMQGVTINSTQQYPGFTNSFIASRVAQRDLKTLSTPIASCTIYANRDAYPLSIGDVFKLTWPDYGITNLVMRVTAIAYGDGKSNKVRINATEDVYALPAESIITYTPPIWTDPNTSPTVATKRLVYEVPYLEAIQQNGQAAVDAAIAADNSIGYAGAAAGRPIGSALNASMNVNSGGGYEKQATIDFSPTAKLVADIGKMDTSFDIKEQDSIDAIELGTWFQINNEIMCIVSYTDPIITVKRGLLDTVPENHLLDSVLYFWDEYSAIDETQYVDGETLSIKITPVSGLGELPLSSAPTDTLNIFGRLARPYPPANLKINNEYFPSIVETPIDLTWNHRDRLQQTDNNYLGFTDSSIGPEPGVLYNVKIYDSSNVEIFTYFGVENNYLNDVALTSFENIRLEIESQNDGLASYQKIIHYFDVIGTYKRITEDGNQRITESFDDRIVEIVGAGGGGAFIPETALLLNFNNSLLDDSENNTVTAYGFLAISSDGVKFNDGYLKVLYPSSVNPIDSKDHDFTYEVIFTIDSLSDRGVEATIFTFGVSNSARRVPSCKISITEPVVGIYKIFATVTLGIVDDFSLTYVIEGSSISIATKYHAVVQRRGQLVEFLLGVYGGLGYIVGTYTFDSRFDYWGLQGLRNGPMTIGGGPATAEITPYPPVQFKGTIHKLKVFNGTALYSDGYTVPTGDLTI